MRETIRKEKKGSRSDHDVRVDVGLGYRPILEFRFYNGSDEKLSTTGYLAIDGDWENARAYFIPVDKGEGWKLQKRPNYKVFTIARYGIDYEKWWRYRGEYDLIEDTRTGEYYIQLTEKEQGND